MFLLFLEFILPYFNKLNLLFQSKICQVHNLCGSFLRLYKAILSCSVKQEFLDNAETLDPKNPKSFVDDKNSFSDTKIGSALNELLEKGAPRSEEIVLFISRRCLLFLTQSAGILKKNSTFLIMVFMKDYLY